MLENQEGFVFASNDDILPDSKVNFQIRHLLLAEEYYIQVRGRGTGPYLLQVSLQPLASGSVHRGDISVATQSEASDLNTTLSGINTIFGNVNIIQEEGTADPITNIDAFHSIDLITGNLKVQRTSLVRLAGITSGGKPAGFASLDMVLGDFHVGDYDRNLRNPDLSTLGDFTDLKEIDGYFLSNENDNLTTLGNFPSLIGIGEYFHVTRNSNLTSLGSFPNLDRIGSGKTFLPFNGRLHDVPNVSIAVLDNPRLSYCSAFSQFITGIKTTPGVRVIWGNAAGCIGEAQTVMFTLATTGVVGQELNLNATASSNLEVNYSSSAPAIAQIGTDEKAGKLILLTEGTATVTASQEGSADFASATPVKRTIIVVPVGSTRPQNDYVFQHLRAM